MFEKFEFIICCVILMIYIVTSTQLNKEIMHINKEISGSEFNTIYKDVKFYKFLNNDLIHKGFKYQLGLNVDTIPFNPDSSCSKGGLYFCQDIHCYEYFLYYGEFIALIEIPNDARVYVENLKFKTDKLIIKSITNFKDIGDGDDIGDDIWPKYLSNTYISLKYIKEHMEEMCKSIVQHNASELHYVEEQYLFLTEEMYKIVTRQYGLALQNIKEQTEQMCKLAVQQNDYALPYVKQQTEETCSEAVKQYGLALQNIKEQTEEICSEAVKQNGYALAYVKQQTEEICKLAVQQNGDALLYVKEQTEEICSEAVKQNGQALLYVRQQTEEICKLAVRQKRAAFLYVNEQFLTEEICKLAIQ